MTRRHFAEVLQSAVAVGAHFYLSLISCLALWALLPMLFGWTPTAVMSGSMEPTLKVGELVVAQPLSLNEIRSGMIRPGHVILADNPMDKGALFTHRVMSIQPDGRFITKGDNNGTLDPEPLSPESVKGIERMKVPLVGFPIHAVHSQNFCSWRSSLTHTWLPRPSVT
jgi:signal peptidase